MSPPAPNPAVAIAQRMQDIERLIPMSWRLPVRYMAQRALGALEPEIAILPQIVRPDRIAVDVGANMGVYTRALSRLAVHVHAFEPQPGCAAPLAAWARGKNVTVHKAGVGARSDTLTLNIPVQTGRTLHTRASFVPTDDRTTQVQVPIVVLDELNLEPVGFIKVDVEGFEHEVLAGALKTIARDRPSLLVELDRGRHTQGSFQAFERLLGPFGYQAHVLRSGKLTACGERAWEHSAEHYNFVFLASP
jgi:FkbM family methyltransferase